MRSIILICFLFILNGCATIIHGNKQGLSINSSPSNASIYINGANVGSTPSYIKLQRNYSYKLDLELDGYLPYRIEIKREFDPLTLINILMTSGMIIGFGVDLISGAIYKLTPDYIYGSFSKNYSVKNKKDNLNLVIILTQDTTLEKIGQLIPIDNNTIDL